MAFPKLISWAQGRKTYIVIAVGVAMGIAQHYNVPIPWWVNIGLMALGGSALRKGVTDETAKTATDLAALMGTVMDSVRTSSEAASRPLPAAVVLPSGRTVMIGKPSPSGQSPAQETVETAALNAAQQGAMKPLPPAS